MVSINHKKINSCLKIHFQKKSTITLTKALELKRSVTRKIKIKSQDTKT